MLCECFAVLIGIAMSGYVIQSYVNIMFMFICLGYVVGTVMLLLLLLSCYVWLLRCYCSCYVVAIAIVMFLLC